MNFHQSHYNVTKENTQFESSLSVSRNEHNNAG